MITLDIFLCAYCSCPLAGKKVEGCQITPIKRFTCFHGKHVLFFLVMRLDFKSLHEQSELFHFNYRFTDEDGEQTCVQFFLHSDHIWTFWFRASCLVFVWGQRFSSGNWSTAVVEEGRLFERANVKSSSFFFLYHSGIVREQILSSRPRGQRRWQQPKVSLKSLEGWSSAAGTFTVMQMEEEAESGRWASVERKTC